MSSGARSSVTGKEKMIEGLRENLVSHTAELLKRNDHKLTAFSDTLVILNPENVLRRGYTITSMNGRVLKSSDEVTRGDLINTDFINGSITSRVTGETDND